MKAIISLACASFIPVIALAAPQLYVQPHNWKTGIEVVRALTKEPVRDADYFERDLMHGYVNGIKDGTQGTIWCFTGTILPHELNIELVHAIKGRSRKDLEGNAAPLILEELRKHYPCDHAKEVK